MNSKRLLHGHVLQPQPRRAAAGFASLRRTFAMIVLGAYLLTGLIAPDQFSMINSQLSIPHASAAVGINPVINYQGKISLIAGSAVGNGTYNMRFKIYDALSGGNLLWSETWSNATTRVTMTGGLFSVGLGTQVAMTGSVNFNTDSLYLQVEFDPGNDGTYEEVFSPRRRFASVPYAHNADTIDGIDSTTFLRKDAANVMTGSIVTTSFLSGSVINASRSLTSSGTLSVKGGVQFKNYTTCALIKTDGNGNLGCGASSFTGSIISVTDGKYVKKGGDTMTGALTINVTGGSQSTIGLKIINTASGAVFHAEKLLTSSGTLITESGAYIDGTTFVVQAGSNKVGIGTASPKTALEVIGTISGSLIMQNGAGSNYFLGNVGIGTTSPDTGLALEIIGTASGRLIHAQDLLRSSGSLIVDSGAYIGGTVTIPNNTSLDTRTTTNGVSNMIKLDGSNILQIGRLTSFQDIYLNGGSSGAPRMAIVGNVNYGVGIGTLTPGSRLSVSGAMIIGNNIGSETAKAQLDVKGTISGSLVTQNGSGVNFFLGKVGIGTTTPTANFMVKGDSGFEMRSGGFNASAIMRMIDTISETSGSRDDLLFESDGAVLIKLDKNANGISGLAGFGIYDDSNKNLLTVLEAGNVGIGGLTSPGSKLSVSGAVIIGNNIGTAVAKAQLDVKGTISGALITQNGRGINYLLGNVSVGTTGSKGAFTVTGSGAFTGTLSGSALNIQGGTSYVLGNLGVGTTNPSEKLEIVGTTSATRAQITTTTGNAVFSMKTDNSYFQFLGGGSTNQFSIYDANTATTVLKIDSSDNFRIGGGSAKAKFDVGGSISGTLLTLSNMHTCTLKTSATGAVICGTDNTGGGSSFGTGNVVTIGDSKYVNVGGDTMTGALTINLTSGYLGLKVMQTASGSVFHAEKALTSSGQIIVRQSGISRGSGALTVTNTTRYGTGAYFASSGAILVLDSTSSAAGNVLSPHILFGYQGTFDTSLSRRAAGVLETKGTFSGALITQNGAGSNYFMGNVGFGTTAPNLGLRTNAGGVVTVQNTPGSTQYGVLELANRTDGDDSVVGMVDFLGSSQTVTESNSLQVAGIQARLEGPTANDRGGALLFFTRPDGNFSTVFERMRINPNGYVGINTNSTVAKSMLTVNGSGAFTGTLSGSALNIQGGTSYILGNLGIGTTTPASALHVVGDVTTGSTGANGTGVGQLTLGGFTYRAGSFGNNGQLLFYSTSNQSGNDRRWAIANNQTTNGALAFYVSSSATTSPDLATPQAPVLLIDKSGNVGIGAVAPKAKLDVVGTISGSTLSLNGTGVTTIMNYKVGIGTLVPTTKLQVVGQVTAQRNDTTGEAGFRVLQTAGTANGAVFSAQWGSTYPFQLMHREDLDYQTFYFRDSLIFNKGGHDFSGGTNQMILSGSRLGIGTLTPQATLDIVSPSKSGSGALSIVPIKNQTGAYIYASGATALALETYTNTGSRTPDILFGYQGNFDVGLYRVGRSKSGALALRVTNTFSNNAASAFEIYANATHTNNKVFRVATNGATFADGSYNSTGADYAEWFMSSDNLLPGEVVCIDVTKKNTVKRCDRDADGNVMGIVSTNPSFVGNSIGGASGIVPPGYALIGLIGQVPANVIIEGSGGVIRAGDSLTAASRPGYARKAQAGESTVGVALEPFDAAQGSTGTVNVLISRRNSSMTVDAVGQKVLDTIADMQIEDEVQLMVSSALGDLNVDDQISDEVAKQINAITAQNANIEAIAAEVESLKAELEALKNRPVSATGTTVITQTGSSFDHLTASSLELETTLVTGGDARIGGDLSIDGTLNASSLFVPNGLTIDGGVTMNGILDAEILHAADASIDGTLTINGNLRLGSGANINLGSGSLTFNELIVEHALFVMGDITIQGMAKFLGNVDIQGELTVSSNQAGFAKIARDETSVTVRFGTGFISTPVVTASPQGRVGTEWWIDQSTATGFTIRLDTPANADVIFAWHALGSIHPFVSQTMVQEGMVFPLASDNIPVSSNMTWNACIRNITILDESGQPLSCSRYHDGYTWTHPDLNISFVWNTSLTPPLLQLPDGYETSVTEDASSILQAINGEGSEIGDQGSDTTDEDAETTEPADGTGTGAAVTDEEPVVGTGAAATDEPPAVNTGSVMEDQGSGVESEEVTPPAEEPAPEIVEGPAPEPETTPSVDEPASEETPQP